MPLSMFKTKLVKILSNILRNILKFKFKIISVFTFQEYHIKKKLYIHVNIWNHFDQYNLLKVIRKAGISITSDDLNPTYYYRKVACEEKLQLTLIIINSMF